MVQNCNKTKNKVFFFHKSTYSKNILQFHIEHKKYKANEDKKKEWNADWALHHRSNKVELDDCLGTTRRVRCTL